jgi:hypothetical protein
MAAWLDACAVAAHLARQGRPAYSPIVYTHPIAIHGGIDPLDHDFWLKFDAPMMEAADSLIVVKMDGWEQSAGIAKEIVAFERMGKPIEYMEWPQ